VPRRAAPRPTSSSSHKSSSRTGDNEYHSHNTTAGLTAAAGAGIQVFTSLLHFATKLPDHSHRRLSACSIRTSKSIQRCWLCPVEFRQ
jgi:hypothetical protein